MRFIESDVRLDVAEYTVRRYCTAQKLVRSCSVMMLDVW
jgi:hypothetical protein